MIHLQGSDGNAACGADDPDNTTLRTQDVECGVCVELVEAARKPDGPQPHSEASRVACIRTAAEIIQNRSLPSLQENLVDGEVRQGPDDLWAAARKFLIEQFESPMPRPVGR